MTEEKKPRAKAKPTPGDALKLLQDAAETLNGIGGNGYRADNRDKRPGFVVYKGDKEIASGKFEYG